MNNLQDITIDTNRAKLIIEIVMTPLLRSELDNKILSGEVVL